MSDYDKEIKLLIDEYLDISIATKYQAIFPYWSKDIKIIKEAYKILDKYKDNKEIQKYPLATAADRAAYDGSLDIVKFFYEKGEILCTNTGIDDAASQGHLDVLIWLLNNTSLKSTKFTLNNAIQMGQTEIVKYLLENNISQIDKYSIPLAIKFNSNELLSYLIKYTKYREL